MMSDNIDKSMTWHQRYGHYHYNSMKLLYTKNMVEGLPSISFENQVCQGCIFGKQHRVPFPLGPNWRAQAPLQLIHAYLCGPMKTPSLKGSRYFLLIVDDYTGLSWVYFLKEKSEAFQKFVEFKALFENMSRYFIKNLRIYRVG